MRMGATSIGVLAQYRMGLDMLNLDQLRSRCDDNGFLRQDEAWDKKIALALAAVEGIELREAHWEILRLLRLFFRTYGDSPANRALVNFVSQHLGPEKGNSLYLMDLFPGSPARVGSKIAGLPKPRNCI